MRMFSGFLSRWSDYSAISKSDLASCLGTSESNIAFLDQNGADGSFNSDPYMGFAFKLTTTAGYRPAGWSEFMVGTGTLVDTTAPTVTIVVADTSLAAGETSLVTFTFSEPVTRFANDDLTIANGTLSPVISTDGGTVYTATLTPTAALTDATNVITVAMTGVTDAAGNAG